MKKYKSKRGITLVALVITIIILLILAGISISSLTNTGIFGKTEDAKNKSEEAQKNQQNILTQYEKEIAIQQSNGKWDGKVNRPEIMTGMTAIQFNDPTDTTEGSEKEVTDSNSTDWYDYDAKKWANAKTEDGSMWVWIPRYAYKVVYDDPNDKSKGGVFDIVFLIGTTDNYYDKDGNLQTAQRQTSENQTIETDSTKTDKYTVHPAFTNETKINYANGGWRKELTGIWVAKFEAGYAGGNNGAEQKDSKIKYRQSQVWASGYETSNGNNGSMIARNYYNPDGYDNTTTYIKYPTFQGLTYSMNYMDHSDGFSISRALTDEGNIYGLSSSSTDSHLMKNSEWGAIAYLGQSQYGLDGTNITINNLTLNNSVKTIYAVTGYASNTGEDAEETNSMANVSKWTEKEGIAASCTGTIYGIYDLSGGGWEKTAAIVNNGNTNLNKYGKAIMNSLNNGKSTEYVTVYPVGEKSKQSLEDANKANYTVNIKIYGDAIRETSTEGIGQLSWNSNYSYFTGSIYPFFIRGGSYFANNAAGLLCFGRRDGGNLYADGFRSVLVAQ